MRAAWVVGMILMTTAGTTMAQDAGQVLRLWPGKAPGVELKVGPETDFTKPTDNLVAGKRLIRLGNVADPSVTVFLPPVGKRNGSAVVVCPGGGFSILAWDLEGTEVAEWLNGIGTAAIVLKYRVPTGSQTPRWMAPAQDAQRALSLTRSKASEWGIRPDRIGVLGFSAGGHTAARAACQVGRRLYDAADAVDQASCKADFVVLVYPAWLVDEKEQKLLPEFKITSETPPMFLVHAFDDPIRCESSLEMFRALKQAGVPSELHVYDAGGHGYGLRAVESLPVTQWPQRCREWLGRRGSLKP